jgi:hypothetical protein
MHLATRSDGSAAFRYAGPVQQEAFRRPRLHPELRASVTRRAPTVPVGGITHAGITYDGGVVRGWRGPERGPSFRARLSLSQKRRQPYPHDLDHRVRGRRERHSCNAILGYGVRASNTPGSHGELERRTGNPWVGTPLPPKGAVRGRACPRARCSGTGKRKMGRRRATARLPLTHHGRISIHHGDLHATATTTSDDYQCLKPSLGVPEVSGTTYP